MLQPRFLSPIHLLCQIFLVIVCCSVICSCASESEKSDTTAIQSGDSNEPINVNIDETQQKEIGLQTTQVKEGLIHKTVEAPGQIQPNAELSTLVSTPSPGRAMKVNSRLGETVKAGDIMAVIKSDAIGQVQSDLLQNVLQAKSDIKQQEVGIKLDRITFDREFILYKEQVSAKADLQAAENQLEKDEANLAALQTKLAAYIKVGQERLTILGAPPDAARKVIAQNKVNPWVIIKAPRAGLVIERTINPGEMNDGSHELFTLANLSQVWLVANIFEKDVELVKKGQEAAVSLDSIPDQKFPAKIVWVGDTINPTTRTLPVRANVPNPNFTLHPNMFARIVISVGDVSVLIVPRSAIVQKGDRTMVFVDKGNGNFERRDIQVGTGDINNIQIKSGLSSGELVVSQGGTALLGTTMKTAQGRGN